MLELCRPTKYFIRIYCRLYVFLVVEEIVGESYIVSVMAL